MCSKVLVIDDDSILVNTVKQVLGAQGHTVDSAANGREGLAYIQDEGKMQEIKLVLLDRLLGDLDGLDILREILKKYGDKVAVIILSVLSAEKDMLEGLKTGAVEYIPKPFNMSVLIEKVKKIAG